MLLDVNDANVSDRIRISVLSTLSDCGFRVTTEESRGPVAGGTGVQLWVQSPGIWCQSPDPLLDVPELTQTTWLVWASLSTSVEWVT